MRKNWIRSDRHREREKKLRRTGDEKSLREEKSTEPTQSGLTLLP